MKKALALVISGVLLSSCVSQKKFTELEELQQNTKNLLDSATVKLNSCNEEKEAALASLATLTEQNQFLKANNQDLINNIGNLTTLSQKGAENLEMSLESMIEKDTPRQHTKLLIKSVVVRQSIKRKKRCAVKQRSIAGRAKNVVDAIELGNIAQLSSSFRTKN